jgi:NADPH2:quinone reductase
MKAVGYQQPLPISEPRSLMDISLPIPKPEGRDLLVKVEAVSVNPVDAKMRAGSKPPDGEYRILDWDAAGIVEAVGPDCTLFRRGDAVFYAGAIGRSGTNAEFHLVDERIVGPKPKSLSSTEAAALPLTAITAWEALFDRLEVRKPVPGTANGILIVGGAGGVGSVAIQLAKALTNLVVIATASRPETQEWVKMLGADYVVDHSKPLAGQVAKLGAGAPAFVFSTTQTDLHFNEIAELIAPQGRFALIDDLASADLMKLKPKSVSLHWELMFTRSIFGTADMIEQHRLLTEVARVVDAGKIKTTLSQSFGAINAENLKRAHAFIESGKAKGKIVLGGF